MLIRIRRYKDLLKQLLERDNKGKNRLSFSSPFFTHKMSYYFSYHLFKFKRGRGVLGMAIDFSELEVTEIIGCDCEGVLV